MLARTLSVALRSGGDFAEVFAEDRASTNVTFDDGRVEDLVSGRQRGAGVRVVRGESTGYAHTADLTEAGLRDAASAAAAAARGSADDTRVVSLERHAVDTPAIAQPPATIAKQAKVAVPERADAAARARGGAVQQVGASYADGRRRILVANSDGLLVEDEQTRTRLSVSCVAVGDTGRRTGTEAPGRTVGFELFDEVSPEDVATTAADRALTMLDARPAPSGPMPVVLRRGAGGVLFHEACGHGLEADLVDRDASVFRGRIGERVAAPGVTLVDDGAYPREWGTYAIDDEGAAARRTTLIDDGQLTDYMYDWLRARKERRASTGNGRRESYRHLPLVRMTNTLLLAGHEDPDQIIADTPRGLYCVALGGGQVDPASGDFVFGVTEAYLIEDGRITAPVRAAQLIGNGPEVLRRIDAIGSDFDTWAGTCGKGQRVPVSSGQPTLRVAELTVGGTARA